MYLLLFTVFIDLVGFAIIFPILPFLALHYGADAREVMLLVAVYSAAQILGAPFWGRVSDRIGRKKVLLLTLAGGGVGYIWFGLAGSLTALFLARGAAGAMAGNVAVAQAYLADISAPEERASAMAKIGAVFGLAFIVGPGLGGILTGTDPEQPQFLLPCLVAAGLSFTACLFGLVLLREPRKHRERAATVPLSEALVTMRRPDVLILVALMATVSLVFSQTISIYPLWLESHFNWGPREVGYVFTYIGLVVAIIQGGLIGSMIRRFGEWRVLTLGATAFIAGLAMVAWITGTPSLVLQTTVLCLGLSLCNPVLTGLISQAAAAEHQGAILGASSAAANTGRIIGPPLAGLVFIEFGVDWPFILGAGLLIPVLARGLWMARRPSAARQ